MEFLKCKACGSFAMVPMDVRLIDQTEEDESGLPDLTDYLTDNGDDELNPESGEPDEQEGESRFYSCHVCGDNWLSIRKSDDEGQSRVTFIHQMGVQPILRRVAHLQTDLVINDRTVDHWEYYLDEDEVAEGEWMTKLADRRRVLRAICSN
jgi:hypothetical protein